MKLEDFALETRNIAAPGKPEKMGEWLRGSGGNQMAIGSFRGQKYQIKVRALKPKWHNATEAIATKRSELAACAPEEREHLQSELDSLLETKDRFDEEDRENDKFITAKNAIFAKINGLGKPNVYGCAPEMWKERFGASGVVSFEATPWLTRYMSVSNDGSLPLCFESLNKSEKYALLSTLADSIAALHRVGVLHGDLKIGNTIIVQDGGRATIGLIDFDGSYILDDMINKRYPKHVWEKIVVGTYFSPEYSEFKDIVYDGTEDEFDQADRSKLSVKIDIFALAFTIWEYLIGDTTNHPLPFVGPDGDEVALAPDEYALAMQAGYTLKLPKNDDGVIDDLLYGLLNWMLAADYNKRPSAEQVSRVLKGDENIIPFEFRRADFSVMPEDADIEFVPVEGKRVLWRPNASGVYDGVGACFTVISANGARRNYDKRRLLAEGLARPKDGTAYVDPSTVANKPWDSDNMPGVELPRCITRTPGRDGSYIYTNATGGKFTKTMRELKDMGFFCTEEDKIKFWPTDARSGRPVYMKPTYVAIRNIDRGPGNYRVQSKADFDAHRQGGFYNCRYDQLIGMGYAVDNPAAASGRAPRIFAAPKPGDGIAWNPDRIPEDIVAITINLFREGTYNVKHQDNTREILTVDQLVERGFARRLG